MCFDFIKLLDSNKFDIYLILRNLVQYVCKYPQYNSNELIKYLMSCHYKPKILYDYNIEDKLIISYIKHIIQLSNYTFDKTTLPFDNLINGLINETLDDLQLINEKKISEVFDIKHSILVKLKLYNGKFINNSRVINMDVINEMYGISNNSDNEEEEKPFDLNILYNKQLNKSINDKINKINNKKIQDENSNESYSCSDVNEEPEDNIKI